jgi:glycogen operon protein
MDELDGRGEWVTDDSFLLCFNAWHEAVEFHLPHGEYGSKWRVVADTSIEPTGEPDIELEGGATLPIPARSLVVLQRSAE